MSRSDNNLFCIQAFEKALLTNDVNIPSSMVYAYAALKEGIPYANGAPNLSVDFPALWHSPRRTGAPSPARTSRPGRR